MKNDFNQIEGLMPLTKEEMIATEGGFFWAFFCFGLCVGFFLGEATEFD